MKPLVYVAKMHACRAVISPYAIEEVSAGDPAAARMGFAPGNAGELMMSDQTQTQNTPWHDPVVQELHDVRDQLVEKYHGEMSAYSKAAKAHALALGFRFGLQAQVDPAAFQVVLAKVPHRTPLAGDE